MHLGGLCDECIAAALGGVVARYNDVTAVGIGGTYASASTLGSTVCGELSEGHSEETLVATVRDSGAFHVRPRRHTRWRA